MKLRLLTLSCLCLHGVAQAQVDMSPVLGRGVVVSERIVSVPVNISENTVKLSRAGYSLPVVKILVAAMADVTLLDHRNFSEGAPCLAAYAVKDPNDVIQDRPALETADLKITLSREATRVREEVEGSDAFGAPKRVEVVCHVTLIENIETTIRGQRFIHQREDDLGRRDLADCR